MVLGFLARNMGDTEATAPVYPLRIASTIKSARFIKSFLCLPRKPQLE
jgi:hypothetical protein